MAGGLDVVVRFIGDASSVQSEAAKIEGTGSKLKGWAKGIAAGLGAAVVVDQLKQATSAAADLADQVGATGVIFGKGSKQVQAFATTTADSFGIAEADALRAAGTFGTFGKSAGLAGTDLAGFSTQMVGLAGDLASFKGGKPEDAVTAIGAALRGESEPIRKYGVLLDDATLKARAMKMGLISTTTDALTPQAKVLAAQAEILAQTGDAQGDFGRTSDSAANQQKKMTANMKEAQAALGTALLPVLQAILPIVTKLAKVFAEHADILVPLAIAIGVVVAAQWAWNAALAANPLGLIVIAIAAVVAAVVLLIQNWDKVKEVAEKVWDAILAVITKVWDWISNNWPLLLAILTGPFGIAVLLITRNWDTIKEAVGKAIDFITNVMSTVGEIITAPFRWAKDQIGNIVDGIKSAFSSAIDAVKKVWNTFVGFWNKIELKVPSVDIPLIGEVGGFTVGLPNLPKLAKGGIVSRPTLALIGESGREAVVPLPNGGVGTTVINVNVTTTGLGPDSPRLQRDIANALRGYVARNGPIGE